MFAMEYKSLPDDNPQHMFNGHSDGPHSAAASPMSNHNDDDGGSIRSFFSKSSKKASKRRVVDGTTAGTSAACDLSEPLTQSAPSETTSVSSSLRDSAHGSAASGAGGEVEMGRMDGCEGDDPFYVFKEDLVRKMTLVDEELEQYLKVVHGTDSAVNTHEVKATKKQLKRHLKHAESTLKDLQKTVKLVDNRRSHFLHISNEELDQRRVFVSGAQDRLKRCKADMSSEEVKEKLLADERALSRRRMGADQKPGSTNEDVSLIINQHAQSELMLQEQDETLDELDDAVERVGQMAGEIHAELGLQNKMLDAFDDDLADAEEKLGLVMGKLAKLLKTKSKCQLGTILILLLTVIILFFLVLYT